MTDLAIEPRLRQIAKPSISLSSAISAPTQFLPRLCACFVFNFKMPFAWHTASSSSCAFLDFRVVYYQRTFQHVADHREIVLPGIGLNCRGMVVEGILLMLGGHSQILRNSIIGTSLRRKS
jgi:hypothetical protein